MNVLRIIGVALLMLTMNEILSSPSAVYAVPIRERDYLPTPKQVDWNETLVPFEIDGKSWDSTLAWFANQASLTLVANHSIPVGTFLYTMPKEPTGQPRKIVLTEIFDMVNERLIEQEEFVLIRGETTLTLLPVDEEIPFHLIPRVNVEDLPKRCRTEIVEVHVNLPAQVDVEEVAPELKRALGAFARVIRTTNNRLVVQADVASLRRHVIPLVRKD